VRIKASGFGRSLGIEIGIPVKFISSRFGSRFGSWSFCRFFKQIFAKSGIFRTQHVELDFRLKAIRTPDFDGLIGDLNDAGL